MALWGIKKNLEMNDDNYCLYLQKFVFGKEVKKDGGRESDCFFKPGRSG